MEFNPSHFKVLDTEPVWNSISKPIAGVAQTPRIPASGHLSSAMSTRIPGWRWGGNSVCVCVVCWWPKLNLQHHQWDACQPLTVKPWEEHYTGLSHYLISLSDPLIFLSDLVDIPKWPFVIWWVKWPLSTTEISKGHFDMAGIYLLYLLKIIYGWMLVNWMQESTANICKHTPECTYIEKIYVHTHMFTLCVCVPTALQTRKLYCLWTRERP